MTQISDRVSLAYPALAGALSTLEEAERTDLTVMSRLGRHVVELFEAGELEATRPAFDLAEHLIVNGGDGERQAAIVGFFETVQNVASHRAFGASVFEAFLGQASVSAWHELNRLWAGKSSLAEVVAAETGASLGRRWWQFWRRRRRPTAREMLDRVENSELRKLIEETTREH